MLVFIFTFIIYLYTLFGAAAPYRDTGEMVTVAHTLGIAHPPGYPLYTLISKIWLLILPFATEGYRLNVLSAAGGALTAWLFYRLLLALEVKKTAAALTAVLFALSYLQWYLSLVSEMYTLNTAAAALVFLLLWKINRQEGPAAPALTQKTSVDRKTLFLTAFIFGAALGIRMDLLLTAPAALIILYANRKRIKFRDMAYTAVFFAAGATVFLYLPLRSNTGPFLDWNHPATLERLMSTLGRKTHGGTLDLVSAPYAAGANFVSTMKFYFSRLFSGFAYAGPLFGLAGLYSLWKRERVFSLALCAAWLFTGPVFIYMANMPPNPHALAILEAHFLLPNLFAAVFMAEGIFAAGNAAGPSLSKAVLPALCLVLIGLQLFNGSRDLNKRWNFIAYDYSKNILRSLPAGSAVVMKKDVQLFALWNRQYVEGERRDASVVAQGLAGSPWYQAGFALFHPDVKPMPLRDKEDWKKFVELNRSKSVFVSPDAEYARPDGFTELPRGLLARVAPLGAKYMPEKMLDEIYPYRGKYSYGAYKEFFTPDLIDDYARARVAMARYYLDKGDFTGARRELNASLSLQPFFPQVYNLIAYTYVVERQFKPALFYYLAAVKQFEKLSEMAAEYNSLEDVRDGIRKDTSEAYLSLGVCSENLSKEDESLSYYSKAIIAWPPQARAYFNRSVIFWKRNDWGNVIRELEQALRIDPGYREAAYYLEMAKRKSNIK